MSAVIENIDLALADDMAELALDPLEFVLYTYPWGKGELADMPGPDVWQSGFLREWGEEIRLRDFDGSTPVMPIRFTTRSGHGIGKSALTAWIADFIRSTRPHSKGIVTANSAPQLQTKTWAEIIKWGRMGLTAHWFNMVSGRGGMKIEHVQHPETWRLDGLAWREALAEAFAGLHAATSTPYYLFDEASRIPRSILEVAEGGLTDGEPMIFLFGNPTKNSGYFYETHNGGMSKRWRSIKVDSRTAARTNKALLEQWIADNGIDSDFVKVRILGDFPAQSSNQLIATDVVEAARVREVNSEIWDPIILGVDVARFGDDDCYLVLRKGRDARLLGHIRLTGKVDTMLLAGKVAEVAREHLPDAINVDGGGVGGGVVDRLRQLNIPNVYEVNFGGKSLDRKARNMAAMMWVKMRDWMATGAIEDDGHLQAELTTREYFYDANNAIQLESKDDLKARGERSPDWADALALTFAVETGPRNIVTTEAAWRGEDLGQAVGIDYDPLNR